MASFLMSFFIPFKVWILLQILKMYPSLSIITMILKGRHGAQDLYTFFIGVSETIRYGESRFDISGFDNEILNGWNQQIREVCNIAGIELKKYQVPQFIIWENRSPLKSTD